MTGISCLCTTLYCSGSGMKSRSSSVKYFSSISIVHVDLGRFKISLHL